MASRTFVVELRQAREQKRLTGETPEERFAAFIHHISEPQNFLLLLEKYPVLAKQLVICMTQSENLIAAGEQPLLIDLEVLFEPQISDQPRPFAYASLIDSVLKTGLLPYRTGAMDIEISGIGGNNQLTPIPVPIWEAAGTDEMRLEYRIVEVPTKVNRPTLNGQNVRSIDYIEQIIEGFERMYRFLQANVGTLLEKELPAFFSDTIRVLLRTTNTYMTLVVESFEPDLLKDGLDRDRLFDLLWIGTEQYPFLSHVFSAQRDALQRGDIPLFFLTPRSRSFSDGNKSFELVEKSGLQVARDSLMQLSEADLIRQKWIVQNAIATLFTEGEKKRTGIQGKSANKEIESSHLLQTAETIGDRLEELAFYSGDAAHWLSVARVMDDVMGIRPATLDLYDGTAGIVLFLSYLGFVSGESRYTLLAKQALNTLRIQIQNWRKNQEKPIGAFVGIGSVIYLFSHLGALWKDPLFFQEAEKLVEELPSLIALDAQFDMLTGSAGCIMSLLSLNAVTSSRRTLDIAVQCGNHLLAHAHPTDKGIGWGETPLTGFAHGNAGIAVSLLELAHVCRNSHFRSAAKKALESERSQFSPGMQNWADLRKNPNENASQEPRYEVAWCNGAAGIGLSRLKIHTRIHDPSFLRKEIDAAVRTTSTYREDSPWLCHGSLGNIELLLVASQQTNSTQYNELLQKKLRGALASWDNGISFGIEKPGLMTGISGVGYELLRLLKPEKVPSVLLIAPPFF